MFFATDFFLFFRLARSPSELPRPIAVKLYRVFDIRLNFIMQVEKLEAKNTQNLGRFYTTSDFDREYPRNDSRYPKSERYVIDNNPASFSGDYYIGPREWPLEFLHALLTKAC